jgi:hypothetical protein
MYLLTEGKVFCCENDKNNSGLNKSMYFSRSEAERPATKLGGRERENISNTLFNKSIDGESS